MTRWFHPLDQSHLRTPMFRRVIQGLFTKLFPNMVRLCDVTAEIHQMLKLYLAASQNGGKSRLPTLRAFTLNQGSCKRREIWSALDENECVPEFIWSKFSKKEYTITRHGRIHEMLKYMYVIDCLKILRYTIYIFLYYTYVQEIYNLRNPIRLLNHQCC